MKKKFFQKKGKGPPLCEIYFFGGKGPPLCENRKNFPKKNFFLKKNRSDRVVAHGRFSTVAKFRDEKMEDKKVMGIGAEEQIFGVRRVAACLLT